MDFAAVPLITKTMKECTQVIYSEYNESLGKPKYCTKMQYCMDIQTVYSLKSTYS
jgi:hypothetical protein